MKNLLIVLLIFSSSAFGQDSKSAIGFSFTPTFSTVRYVSDGTYHDTTIRDIKKLESGTFGLAGNFFFQVQAHDRVALTWGLGYQRFGYSSNIVSESILQMEDFRSSKRFSRHYFELMVSSKFRVYKTLYARLGIGASALAAQRLKMEQSTLNGSFSYNGWDNESELKDLIFPSSFGFGYELKVKENLNLMAEASGVFVLGRSYKDAAIDRSPIQMGISIGLIKYY